MPFDTKDLCFNVFFCKMQPFHTRFTFEWNLFEFAFPTFYIQPGRLSLRIICCCIPFSVQGCLVCSFQPIYIRNLWKYLGYPGHCCQPVRDNSITTWTRWGGRGSKYVCFCPRSGYKNCPRRGGWGQKMAKFCPCSCRMTPYLQTQPSIVIYV